MLDVRPLIVDNVVLESCHGSLIVPDDALVFLILPTDSALHRWLSTCAKNLRRSRRGVEYSSYCCAESAVSTLC